mgnify:CR=1 FL=1
MCEHCQNVKIPPLSRPLFSNRYRCPECGAEFREVVRIGKKRIGTPILVWILDRLSALGYLKYTLVFSPHGSADKKHCPNRIAVPK